MVRRDPDGARECRLGEVEVSLEEAPSLDRVSVESGGLLRASSNSQIVKLIEKHAPLSLHSLLIVLLRGRRCGLLVVGKKRIAHFRFLGIRQELVVWKRFLIFDLCRKYFSVVPVHGH